MTESARDRRRRERRERNESLRAVLRRGDPYGDAGVAATGARDALRRLIVDAARSPSPSAWSIRPLAAGAAIAVLLLGAAFLLRQGMPGREQAHPAGAALIDPGPPSPAEGGDPMAAGPRAAGSGDPADRPPIRNVQFTTRGGTRIVWVLNRDLDI
jgi:hypothetical protein